MRAIPQWNCMLGWYTHVRIGLKELRTCVQCMEEIETALGNQMSAILHMKSPRLSGDATDQSQVTGSETTIHPKSAWH